jgi:hypothetical protein
MPTIDREGCDENETGRPFWIQIHVTDQPADGAVGGDQAQRRVGEVHDRWDRQHHEDVWADAADHRAGRGEPPPGQHGRADEDGGRMLAVKGMPSS